MSKETFYLTLPSNSSLKNYPENTVAEYTTQLSRTIQLDGEWEVALAEIQYPRTWNNVRIHHNWIYVRRVKSGFWNAEIIPEGFYSDVNTLVKNINQAIAKQGVEHSINLSFDNLSGKVTVEIKNGVELYFKDDIAVILGFDMDMIFDKTTQSSRVADINAGLYSFYVYCDIVEAQLVGDSEVPLLRIVPVEGQHGEMVTKTFQNLQYLPIVKKQFSSVEMNIKTDTGEKVPFESGKLITTLHLRRSSYLI